MVRMTCKLCGWSTLDEINIIYAVDSLEKHFDYHVKKGEMEKTQMSEDERKCPECNTEMKYIADFPTGRESWGVEISVYLYQCPKCKTVKTWSDD